MHKWVSLRKKHFKDKDEDDDIVHGDNDDGAKYFVDGDEVWSKIIGLEGASARSVNFGNLVKTDKCWKMLQKVTNAQAETNGHFLFSTLTVDDDDDWINLYKFALSKWEDDYLKM